MLFLALPVRADEAVKVAVLGMPESPDLKGLSGLEVSEDGTHFVAIADRGWFVTGRILREKGGPVALSVDLPAVSMSRDKGGSMRGHGHDAEGLAIAPDGRIFVSFEDDHRIEARRLIRARAIRLPDLPDAPRLGGNSGIEALALGPDGALYALPETLVEASGIPVYRYLLPASNTGPDGGPAGRYREAAWNRDLSLPARGPFHPVGADFGPDGRLYVLERAFVPPLAFRSRVRRFALGPAGPTEEVILLETGIGRHGNLEGLSVWRDAAGAIRLTMVTDDNGMALQRNELVEYRVVSAPGDG
ncbi:hypothetical protein EV655_11428 [Rhodovulum euryhalinum]|uniref:Phytase-like domain-containing protein n=1 Tax=Rhodovulum euryhalinum TaxID=35805 RepID=A0A4R2KGJ3_9RHOB|nr:hypothetical protein EV655_11428 [Rhodovulum euryhalinum]